METRAVRLSLPPAERVRACRLSVLMLVEMSARVGSDSRRRPVLTSTTHGTSWRMRYFHYQRRLQ